MDNKDDKMFQYLNNATDTFNNLNQRDVASTEWIGKIYAAMPLYKLLTLNLSADHWQQLNKTEQITNSAENRFNNQFEQNYTTQIDSLSIKFNNHQTQNSVKPFLSIRGKYYYMSGGVTWLNLLLENSYQSGQVLAPKNYNKILPFYSLSYYPARKAYLHFSASKTTEFPKITDLLPVLNIGNNYERSIGNEFLNPSDNYNVRIYTSLYKLKGFKYFYFGSSASMSNNAKIWVNKQGDDGIIVKTPENASGKNNLNAWFNVSKKLYKIAYLSLSANKNDSKTPIVINNQKAFSVNKGTSLSPTFNLSYSDSLELSVGMTWNRNNFSNTINKNLDYIQDIYSYSFEARVLFKPGTELNTSLNISDQRNVPGIGKVIPIWNAYIQQPLGKKSKLNLKLTAYDILKQNTSIRRYQNDNFVYINQSNQLQQYFMLTLVYKIKKMGGQEGMNYVY
ncbi:MAG: outer membrane beta-barrel protein [Bacteroidia bacterium]